MSRVIVYERPADGGLSVLIPAPADRRPGETVAQQLARLAARYVPAGAASRVVEDTDLPGRRFRQCWRVISGAVAVHLPSARLQRLAELRARRNALLDASDSERARLEDVGTAEQREALRSYRQALRDLTTTVQAELEALSSADALASYEPAWPVAPA